MRTSSIVKPEKQTGSWSKWGRRAGEVVGRRVAGQMGKVIGGAVGEAVGQILDKPPVGTTY